ncbi:MAG: glycosyltransferase family A protein, partial [Acidobacteriota bacterium]
MTPPEPRLSVVVVVYDMPEVALRTLHSLSPAYQRGIDGAEYEVIVVENGSRRPLDAERVRAFGDGFRYLAVDDASPSPAAALNRGVDLARGDVVGLMIDGARLATPGLLSEALRAFDLYGEQTVVATLGFLLKAPAPVEPASRAASDRALLDGIDWPRDGDRLFEVGVLGGSSRGGWGETPAESNAIFLSTPRYRRLGGYDEAFQLPGGGSAAWKERS